jgi:alpha-galactosidase
MWAINKSPLIIGAALDPDRLSKTSLEILSNKEVIALNQDPLAKQAQLVRRHTEEEYDIWLGDLSGSKKVLGVANWKNDSQSVQIDLASLDIKQANARDVWAAKDLGSTQGTQNITLAGHEMRLWILSNITASSPLSSSGYHAAADASLTGGACTEPCASGTCLPTSSKIINIAANSSVTFSSVHATSPGKKIVGIDFVNYDYAFTTAWDWGDNARNATIAVNGAAPKRWAFPLSGGNWQESERLVVEVDGFVEGDGNKVVFSGFGNGWAPDLVGIEVLE